mmetsp:Transcript_21974/g.25404  ORF Transcript_21974/g.25404 Transcript_21974/m.25404 type:complete len:357 (-) Transcript_21974:191-1261(-)
MNGHPSHIHGFRPASARSMGSGISMESTASEKALKSERNLLERMVQERDEKIKSLQTTIAMQEISIDKLQQKNDREDEKGLQHAARQKLYLQSVTHEKNLAKSQLKVLQKENQRIKDDPIHKLLTSHTPPKMNFPGSHVFFKKPASPSESIGASTDTNSDVSPQPIPPPTSPPLRLFSDDPKTLLLQSQLYQAMNSLSSLQHQTVALKKNYDAILDSLQQDSMRADEDKARLEVKLLSRIAVIEREKTIIEAVLNEKIKARDLKIKRMEKNLKRLDIIADDDASLDDDYSDSQESTPDNNENDNKSQRTKNTSITRQSLKKRRESHEEVDDMISELEMLSAHSSSRRLFSSINEDD